jgi:maltose/moltooligosaccharide transporter
LWLAAPLTGLLVQPIVGQASDRTWGRLGRRRPYFLAGAILSSIALILMPRSSTLWMAAGLLWVLDASINISMQPFRAFVTDLLPESQGTRGYAMQSLFIGLATVIASALPFLLTNVFHLAETRAAGTIPFTVRASFYMGAVAFLGAVLWTVFTTKRISAGKSGGIQETEGRGRGRGGGDARDLDVDSQDAARDEATGVGADLHVAGVVLHVALFSGGRGAQCFRRSGHKLSSLFGRGGVGGRLLWNVLAGVLRIFIRAARAGAESSDARRPHALCLICGGLGLLSVAVIHNKMLLLLSMTGVGVGWGEYAFHALLDSGRIAA